MVVEDVSKPCRVVSKVTLRGRVFNRQIFSESSSERNASSHEFEDGDVDKS
jgi:hypothetical protein